jgi:hypothetical protein
MKHLSTSDNFDDTIHIAEKLKGTYDKTVLFHSYWNGILNEKHYYSVVRK